MKRLIANNFPPNTSDAALSSHVEKLKTHVHKSHYGAEITAVNLKLLMQKALQSACGVATLSTEPFDRVIDNVNRVERNKSCAPGKISTKVEHNDILSVSYDASSKRFSAGPANYSQIISDPTKEYIHNFNTIYPFRPKRSNSAQNAGVLDVEANSNSPSEVFENFADSIKQYAASKQFTY